MNRAAVKAWLTARVPVRRWWLVLFGCLLFAAAVAADAATIHVQQAITPRQSTGAYDAAYPDGDDASPLTWGTIPNLQIYVGDSCAFNLRTLGSLTGTNAATATLAKVSGTLPDDCIEGTDGITGTASAASMGQTFVWRATDGTPADSNSFSLTVLALPVADTTAPTIPTNCSGVGGTGTVTITCDASSDPYVGEAGSGVSAYNIYLGDTLVATKTAPSANAQPVLSQKLVGGTDGTVTNTQSGADRLLGFGGAGLAATDDQFIGVGHQVNGDFTASTTITAYTSGVSTHHGGLIVYADPDDASCSGNACAAFYACRIKADGKPQVRYRTATGATAANGTLGAAVSLPYRVRIVATASGYECLISSDGNTWTATEAPRALSLGSLPYVMAYCTSGTAGQTSQCDLDQIHITTAVPWSQVVTTDVGGSWQVEAWDSVTPTENKSAKGTAFTATPTEPAGGGGDCTGDPAPSLVHFDDFDAATVDSARWNVSNCGGSDAFSPTQDSCPTPSTLRARSGARALRSQITFHDGAGNWYHKRDNPIDQIAHRTELSIKAWSTTGCPSGATCASSYDPSTLDIGDEQWYGIATFHPGSGDANGEPTISVGLKNTQFVNWQLHDTPDVGEVSRSPPLALNLKATPIVADLPSYPDTTGTTGSAQTSPPTVTPTYWNFWTLFDADAIQTANSYDGGRKFFPGEFTDDAGGWVDWVIRYKPNYTAAGILEIWKRRVGVDADFTKVVSYFGPTAPNDQTAPFLKMGIYSGGGNPAVPPADWPARAVVYHDSHRMALTTTNPSSAVGTDNCAFQLVAPSGTAH